MTWDQMADWITDWFLGPHSAWGWVLDAGSVVGGVWLAVFSIVCFIQRCLDAGSAAANRSRAEAARLSEYRSAIDALYDRAEQEVQGITDRSIGG
jgi:hypothetical protein